MTVGKIEFIGGPRVYYLVVKSESILDVAELLKIARAIFCGGGRAKFNDKINWKPPWWPTFLLIAYGFLHFEIMTDLLKIAECFTIRSFHSPLGSLVLDDGNGKISDLAPPV